MLNIFVPVLESVWKRKEAKIYIGFAFLYPVLFLISTFLPKGSNFLIPSVAEGLYFSYDVTYSLLLPSVYDFVLPVLALFYLTYTVFKGEADSHTMFLYKDINRSQIFWAKILSLMTLVFIFLALFSVSFTVVYYGRMVNAYDFFKPEFFNRQEPYLKFQFLYIIVSFLFDSLLCVLIAACVSLYSGVGLTMVLGFAYSIGSTLLNVFGLKYLIPTGMSDYVLEGMNLIVAIGNSGLLTLVYGVILVLFTLKHFRSLEF